MYRLCPVALVALFAANLPARAAEPAEVLRFMPKQAGLVLTVEDPRRLAETIVGLKALQDAATLPAVREVLDGTATRRALQLLSYVERETGTKWPELLDKVAGRGIALGVSYGTEPNPALLVIRGTDEDATEEVFNLFMRVAEDELARQGSPDKLERTRRGEAQTVHVGKELHFARQGATLFASNRADALTAGLDLASSGKRSECVLVHKTLAAARKQLPKKPLAWFWLDFDYVRNTKAAKDFFDATRKDVFQTLLFGGTADCLRRSDYVAGGLYAAKEEFRFVVRFPAGRAGFPPEFALHAPPAHEPGSKAFLEPPGTLYSESFYLDPAAFWAQRDTLLNPQVRRDFEKAEKDISKFVPGVKFGELLSLWGGYHRVVIANVDRPPYQAEPGQRLPAFGVVTTMRDPQFGKSVAGLIRGAGFLFSLQYGLKMAEETVDGVKVVGYRFPEDRPLAGDDAHLRYNFEPAFAVVGDQFIVASTMELAKKLIPEVRRTAYQPGSPLVWRAKGFATGVADALLTGPDAAVSETVLRQAVGLAEARRQVDQLAAYLRTLGTVGIEVDQAPAEYRFDAIWRTGRNKN